MKLHAKLDPNGTGTGADGPQEAVTVANHGVRQACQWARQVLLTPNPLPNIPLLSIAQCVSYLAGCGASLMDQLLIPLSVPLLNLQPSAYGNDPLPDPIPPPCLSTSST